MNPAFIAEQKTRLEALRAQLAGGERAAVSAERAFREDHVEEAREFEDDAQDLARQEIEQARHDVDKVRLNDINRALEKIDEGTYGRSDVSGKAIPLARLEASPEAIRTVDEQQHK
ncbi:MAG: TraR/DksA family transcriptional regulator [Casimicrobiaceae bacterium]